MPVKTRTRHYSPPRQCTASCCCSSSKITIKLAQDVLPYLPLWGITQQITSRMKVSDQRNERCTETVASWTVDRLLAV